MKDMYKFQDSLPVLPVPEISKSMQWYLKCLKPLLDDTDYKEAQLLAESFLENEGPVLQNKLLEYSKSISPNSWLMPYSREIYLSMREPVTLVGNYLIELAQLGLSEAYGYLEFASVMIHSLGDLYLEIVNETFPPMTAKETPLCMKQFEGIFRGTKIPCKNKDEFVTYKDIEEVHSFGVFYKNKYYAVRLIESNSEVVSCQSIRNALSKIYEDREEGLEINFSTIAFAGSERASQLIETLCEDESNQNSFAIVNQTMFNIVLSNEISSKYTSEDKLYTNTKDIWPYKPWNITIYKDKICSFNNEHTYMDGLTNLYLIGLMVDKMKSLQPQFSNTQETSQTIPVHFNLNQQLIETLTEIKNEYEIKSNKLSGLVFIRKNIRMKMLKTHKINIDSLFQLAFQYAQLEAYGEMRTTHESVSVTQYYEGRTSCIRSGSEEAACFVKALQQNNLSAKELLSLFSEASKEHVDRIKHAKEFCCLIRHAAGLNIIYDKFGSELGIEKRPELFNHSSFIKYCTQELSTSTVGNTWFVNKFVFAPVTEGGIGIGYLTHGDVFIASISYYKNDKDKINIFKQSLDSYFDKVENLFSVLEL